MGGPPEMIACGDRAVLMRLGRGIDPAVNAQVHAAARALNALEHPAITEVVPAYDALLVEYDPIRLRWDELCRLLTGAAGSTAAAAAGRVVTVPVLYGGEGGPDLDDVAAHAGLSPAEVVRRHAAGAYRVYCLGFSPGFCYLGGLDPALATPRLSAPRVKVPTGSVGIGGSQTGVYPSESPGGWRLLGRTPAVLFDPDRPQPSLVEPGDVVRFTLVDAATFLTMQLQRGAPRPQNGPVEETGRPGLRILSPGLLTTVQDLGRRGYQALGVPVAGAVDYWAVMVGNWLLGNRARKAALEITLSGPEVEFTGPVAFCLTGAPVPAELVPAGGGSPVRVPGWMSQLAGPGDRLRIGTAAAGCRAYLCVAGGLDVPAVLGSRSEDLFAKLGPFGRPLKAGDWLPAGEPVLSPADLAGRVLPVDAVPHYHGAWQGALEVRVVLGPQQDAFTAAGIDTFLSGEYRVGAKSDRQGARLEGPAIAHRGAADIVSEGMPAGGIQVPADGKPIVLLANRQTIGGYAKIAVGLYPDVARVGQLRPGDTLRFRPVDLHEAHQIAWAERRELARVRRLLEKEAAGATGRGAPPALLRPAPVPAPAPAAAPVPAAELGGPRRFKVRIDAMEFDVEVVEEEE